MEALSFNGRGTDNRIFYMIIFAVDPGTSYSAVVELDTDRKRVLFSTYDENVKILNLINFIDRKRIDIFAVEMVASFGMPVGAEVFETVKWIGKFERQAEIGMLKVIEIKRHEEKTILCYNSRAKDANIRQALIDLIGPQGTKKAPGPTYGISGDRWSALAVAVTAKIKISGEW